MAAILADDIFNCIFLSENDRISIQISLKYVPMSSIDNKTALVQVMAWRRTNRRQAITWTKFDPVHWRIYALRWVKAVAAMGLFYWHGLTLIPAWISNHMPSKVWEEIIYPFPNFNGCIVEVWEEISNFVTHFSGHMITYPCWGFSYTMLVKGAPVERRLATGRKAINFWFTIF